jgi:tripartite-type tricarboxylate transporter receptor subunit TctC
MTQEGSMGNPVTAACRLTVLVLAFSVPAVLWNPRASAQGYPAKPIRIIASSAAGAPPDFVARTMAQYLTTALGQQVIVENRPGAGGTIATAAAAKSSADGYTLLLASTSNLSISPSLYANPGYDPVTSFAPISLLATAPFLVMVHPSLTARSLKELIALAKAKLGELNYGSAGSGSPLHIGAEMLKTAAGVQLVHVPYKGPAAAVVDLLSGRIQVLVEQLYPVAQHIQTGKIRPLAVASVTRHPQLPELPTAAEAGLPGYEVVAWMGLVAPRGTAGDVIKRLNVELVKALRTQEVRDGLFSQGLQPAGNSPEEFAAFIASEGARWSRAVRNSGAKVD